MHLISYSMILPRSHRALYLHMATPRPLLCGLPTIISRRLSGCFAPEGSSEKHQAFKLRDGRSLGFAEFGKPSGTPVFYFHGSPGSRLEAEDWDEVSRKLDVRVIGLDRPGIGLSSMKVGYKLTDWPLDVDQLAKHLGFEAYHVFGGSGGGPWSVACARVLPTDVLPASGVIAGIAPKEAGSKGLGWQRWISYELNRRLPDYVLRYLMDVSFTRSAQSEDPKEFEKVLENVKLQFVPQDQKLLEDEVIKQRMVAIMREAFRHGADGAVLDAQTILLPWQFELKDVPGKVKLWYGTGDVHTPPDYGRYLERNIPNATLKIYEGDSHIAIFFRHQEEILRELLEL